MTRLLIGALLLTLTMPAEAQERVLERDFLLVLQGEHPALAVLGERLETARAQRVRSGLLSNPTASFEREAPGSTEQITWQLAWAPPLDRRRGAAVRAADAGLQAATAQLESDRLALRSELRSVFADWAISAERTQVVETHLALIRRLADQMEARAARGEDSRLAARRLALAALEVEAEAARSAAAAVRSRELAFALHGRLSAGSDPARPSLPAVTDSLQATVRPDLQARGFEVEQAEWQLQRGRRFLQFPEITFGWQTIRNETFREEGPLLGVIWPLPIFERQQPEQIEASTQVAAARGRLQLAEARARADLVASRAAYERLRTAALDGMETIRESERAVESATATFRLGESRLTDLLETLRSVLSARLAALDLYADALEAHRTLEIATGSPLSTEE